MWILGDKPLTEAPVKNNWMDDFWVYSPFVSVSIIWGLTYNMHSSKSDYKETITNIFGQSCIKNIKCDPSSEPELQIRRGNSDNLGIISIFLHKNIFCDPSLQPSRQDGSNEGSQDMFSLRNKKNYLSGFSFGSRSAVPDFYIFGLGLQLFRKVLQNYMVGLLLF